MDEVDQAWVSEFKGEGSKSIPEGAIIEGFISIIKWINPDGSHDWRSYNTIDAPLSHILGLLQMAGFAMMQDNLVNRED